MRGAGRLGRRARTRALLGALLLTAAAALATGCSVVHDAGTWNDPHDGPLSAGSKVTAGSTATAPAGSNASTAPQVEAYDVTPLLQPSRKILGVEISGAPESLAPAEQFAGWAGTKPNLLGEYLAWGTSFDSAAAKNAYSYGAMDFVVWEPWSPTLTQIAAGASDAYITAFATAVRAANVPIALSFGHEFNGNWYPWGTSKTTPAAFVAAWQHIHNLFEAAGATNVIWVWDPNDIFPVPDVQLKAYYPGDAYVDWAAVTGYWSEDGPNTYASLYLPTLEEIRTFTQKPFLIAETAVAPGGNQSASLTALFKAVEQHSDIVGFVWYDYDKGGDWRIENRPTLMAQFKTEAAAGGFGFDVSKLG
ncbi:glycoside hydrolase family 26 protein [Actinospica robiniae]|uniref:glycoside hydrolase family 26 protein n=1 Tax=Actinospica robiniae TaxID=304901 RepID=UPI0004156F0B|nr:glycosyl hydrolase [Actinospica robiniae]